MAGILESFRLLPAGKVFLQVYKKNSSYWLYLMPKDGSVPLV